MEKRDTPASVRRKDMSAQLTSSAAFGEYVKATAAGRPVSKSGAHGYNEAEWEAWQAALLYVSPLIERMVQLHASTCRSEPMSDIARDAHIFLEGMKT